MMTALRFLVRLAALVFVVALAASALVLAAPALVFAASAVLCGAVGAWLFLAASRC